MTASFVILRYELKRLIGDRRHLYSMLIIAVMTWDILVRVIAGGSYHTAPYSEWSYASFLSMISPVLVTMIVLLCSRFTDRSARGSDQIIQATPFSPLRFWLIRTTAIVLVFGISLTLPIGMSILYYVVFFEQTHLTHLVIPTLLMVVPPAMLFLGLALLVSRLSGPLSYGLIPLALILGLVNLDLPAWLDPFGNNMLITYPVLLSMKSGGLAIPFTLPTDFLLTRWLHAALGVGLTVWGCLYRGRR